MTAKRLALWLALACIAAANFEAVLYLLSVWLRPGPVVVACKQVVPDGRAFLCTPLEESAAWRATAAFYVRAPAKAPASEHKCPKAVAAYGQPGALPVEAPMAGQDGTEQSACANEPSSLGWYFQSSDTSFERATGPLQSIRLTFDRLVPSAEVEARVRP